MQRLQLRGEHLGDEIVREMALATMDRGKPQFQLPHRRRPLALQRQRDQVQPGGPPLGALLEMVEGRILKRERQCLLEKRSRLCASEA